MVGSYTIHTKDRLEWIVEGVRHIATVNQGRWRLPSGAYDESGVGEEAQREYVESVRAVLSNSGRASRPCTIDLY